MRFEVSVVGALVPIFIVILSGYGFRRFHFPGDDFWPYVERFTYFLLFPALLLEKTATASLDLGTVSPMIGALGAAILVMTGLLLIMRFWWQAGEAAFTSFFQGGIRFNTYVGLSAAYALFGDQGMVLAAVVIAVLIPLVNFLCVTVLIIFVNQNKNNARTVVMEIIRNPLIMACTAGIMLNISGIRLHPGIDETLNIFGRASLPLGLLAVGAGLDVIAIRATAKIVLFSCILKLIILPAFMWIASKGLQMNNTAAAIAVLFAALPGSGSSYILARQLGGDSALMANIVTVQILFSMLTLPVIMALLFV